MEVVLKDVTVCIPPRKRVLFHIDEFSVPSGSSLLIHGSSGIGKTTLLHLIAGLFLPDAGMVLLGGSEMTRLSDRARGRIRREHVGIIFQRLNLIEHLTPLENVMLPLRQLRDARGRSLRALRTLGIEGLRDELSGNLSLGEQQRVAVARVLALSPSLILADEPTSSLDEKNATQVLDALLEAAEGKTLIVVSHDRRIGDRFLTVIDFEKVVAA